MSVLKTVAGEGASGRELLSAIRERAAGAGEEVRKTVSAVISEVRSRGFEAVSEYSVRFDGCAPRELSAQELCRAASLCEPRLISALTAASENIRAFHERGLSRSWQWDKGRGRRVGQIVRGLDRVGMYVPGGTAAYPSTVLMNGIPAKCAGVRELIMVTPPGENLRPSVLAAAHLAGVDRVISVGGAQAIAALAMGAGFIPRVDKIVGPGNAYVAEAKRQVFGMVDIDMIAGPSEILIIADNTANPAFVAYDLLSQAEHDERAGALLLTDSPELAVSVERETERALSHMPRGDIARRALSDYGAIFLFDDIAGCVRLANELAPEHLELMTAAPGELLPGIKNAGAVFIGPYSPEPLGDYMAGPCHVLPTSGTARFFSPLSAESFLKRMSVIEYDEAALREAAPYIGELSAEEGLEAHRRSVQIRFSSFGKGAENSENPG